MIEKNLSEPGASPGSSSDDLIAQKNLIARKKEVSDRLAAAEREKEALENEHDALGLGQTPDLENGDDIPKWNRLSSLRNRINDADARIRGIIEIREGLELGSRKKSGLKPPE